MRMKKKNDTKAKDGKKVDNKLKRGKIKLKFICYSNNNSNKMQNKI